MNRILLLTVSTFLFFGFTLFFNTSTDAGVNTMKIAHEQVEGLSFAIPIQIVFQEFGAYLK